MVGAPPLQLAGTEIFEYFPLSQNFFFLGTALSRSAVCDVAERVVAVPRSERSLCGSTAIKKERKTREVNKRTGAP